MKEFVIFILFLLWISESDKAHRLRVEKVTLTKEIIDLKQQLKPKP